MRSWSAALLLAGCFLDRSGLVGAPDAGREASTADAACTAELCDGIDNDCDPATADGADELGTPCDGDDSDRCEDDTAVACTDGALVCGTSSDGVEVCNGADDDCDGEIDAPAICPCNFARFGGHVYLICDGTQRTWVDALASCPAGYGLAQITSAEEQAFLESAAAALSVADFWIGARDPEDDGTFRWEVDGSAVPAPGGPGYEHWGSGLPDGSGTCVELDLDGSTAEAGTWNDAPCDEANRAICESI